MAARLDYCERMRIEAMRRAGIRVAEIAEALGRHSSTIYRELDRPGCRPVYNAEAAQAAADAAARRPKPFKLARGRSLSKMVHEDGLQMRWSPHAIAAYLKSKGHKICAETIYKACYDHNGKPGLPAGSYKLLPRQRKRHKPRSRRRPKRQPLGDYRPLSQRPAAASQRSEPGHWEGGLINGKHNRSAVVTLVERVSRLVLIAALPHGRSAASTAAAVIDLLSRQPPRLAKTLTWDQGRKMAHWHKIKAAIGVKVYFCEPRSPWQRPSNEQTNGLLRRWLPKGTDLNVSPITLAMIEDDLNFMPRKLHDWLPAQTVYDELKEQLTRNHH